MTRQRIIDRGLAAALLLSLGSLAAAGCGSSSEQTPTYFDFCEEDISDDECYALRRDPDSEQIEQAKAIARRYMENHPPASESWDWTSGVFMFALTELYRVTGEEEFRDYYRAYLEHHIGIGYVMFWSDSCPPGLTALGLLRYEDDTRYEQVVDDVLEYLDGVPRTDEGGIWHLGPQGGALDPGIWIDSLFMFGMVLNRQFEAAEDEDALALMEEQLGVFSSVLQHENGLFQHADQSLSEFDTDVYWARGNSWVTVALADYLRVRFLRAEPDAQAEQMFARQVAGALASQDPDSGLWWTVMNRPAEGDNYLEASGSALFAHAMARAYRYDLVGETELEAAKRAVAGVRTFIVDDEEGKPVVTGISGGTDPTTFEGYVSVPLREDINFGVGAVILALVETSGL
jgi:unsaturated rhamnogalacturonyl hydrolase